MTTSTFKTQLGSLHRQMRTFSMKVHTNTWQSIDISKKPEAEMRELTDVFFRCIMPSEVLTYYKDAIEPNLPWADRHFILERVSGSPINPGETWKDWPFGNSAAGFLEDHLFSHTYAERYWPKRANREGYTEIDKVDGYCHEGIRFEYGDLGDVIKLLAHDPYTRQAYLPVWFPEDTGVVHGKRVPCTLGYHFIMRDNQLSVFYAIRSCDWYRHARDDIYLTVRLLLWLLQQLRRANPEMWNHVLPGTFSMWIGSLHLFINDYNVMYAKPK
jgi:hypothetical protein